MSPDDAKLLEHITNALNKIDSKGAGVRFKTDGDHISEHQIIANLDGYKVLGLRMAAAALRSPTQTGSLQLDISDITMFADRDGDIGFDTFVLDEKCESLPADWESKVRNKRFEKIRPYLITMFIGAFGYVFCEGVFAIYHKLF